MPQSAENSGFDEDEEADDDVETAGPANISSSSKEKKDPWPIVTDFLNPDITYKKSRDLHIYTWGKAILKNKPAKSQMNFNASVMRPLVKDILVTKIKDLKVIYNVLRYLIVQEFVP